MKANNVPLTQKNYIDLAFMGNPPEDFNAEHAAEMPEELP